jgi:hypothetical protein
MRRIAMLGALGGLLVVGVPGAIADGDPMTPAGCTFSKGTTVCATTTSSTVQVPGTDANGCVISTPVTTTVTTFSAHRGAPNSNGKEVAAPPAVTTTSDGTPTIVSCGTGTGTSAGGV